MPSESTPAAREPPSSHSGPPGNIKCAICGLGNFSSSTSSGASANEGLVVLTDPIQRVCGRCVNAEHNRRWTQDSLQDRHEAGAVLGLGLRGVIPDLPNDGSVIVTEDPVPLTPSPEPSSSRCQSPDSVRSGSPSQTFSQSLPAHPALPWSTKAGTPLGLVPELSSTGSTPPPAVRSRDKEPSVEEDRPANPLLDITKARVPSIGRGALYPGSVFKGSQTSGRSAYEVEIQLLDVNFAESSVSGYLSISHLTDSHPHLTTFFTGEIIGPTNGFITGTRFGATEHDDMRHWGRFEQFRRPATRADMVRPELFFRDPLPDRSRGETRAKERDFVFLRIKERFLVPDHKVRDISGASFAGFYYAMVDLSPTVTIATEPPSTPTSPTTPKLPSVTGAGPSFPMPMFIRRQSSTNDARSGSRPEAGRRRESASRLRENREVRGEATIRGYYFHSLNQEPFQELFLTHVPQRSSSTFEFR